MKTQLALLLLSLSVIGCSGATPMLKANLVLGRLYSQAKIASANNDYPAARAAFAQAKGDYHKVMGESPLFDRWIGLWLELVDLDEKASIAKGNGADIAPYRTKAEPIKEEIFALVPVIRRDIQLAQIDADQRAQNTATFGNALGAMAFGFAGGILAAEAERVQQQTTTSKATKVFINSNSSC